jgi:hypothetical protein
MIYNTTDNVDLYHVEDHDEEDPEQEEEEGTFSPSGVDWIDGNYYAQEPLYQGADHSILAFVLLLFELKTRYKTNFPDVLLLDILKTFHKILPANNNVPLRTAQGASPSVNLFYKIVESFSKVEKQTIDICMNGCVAYVNEFEGKTFCPKCNLQRYKRCTSCVISVRSEKRTRNENICRHKKKSTRVAFYVPISPRIDALLNDSETRSLLTNYPRESANFLNDRNIIHDIYQGDVYRSQINTDQLHLSVAIGYDGFVPFER